MRADKDAEAHITYDSGLVVIVDQAKGFALSLGEWYERQVADGVPSSLETIGGVEA